MATPPCSRCREVQNYLPDVHSGIRDGRHGCENTVEISRVLLGKVAKVRSQKHNQEAALDCRIRGELLSEVRTANFDARILLVNFTVEGKFSGAGAVCALRLGTASPNSR